MFDSIVPTKKEDGKSQNQKIDLIEFEGRENYQMTIEDFLTNDSYHYCLYAYPGIGKSTTVIKALQSLKMNFVYLAATKKTANQLAERNNLPVFHADSDDKISNQTISIYDHLDKFIDWDNLDSLKDVVLVVDECHNIIQQRSHKFRANVLRMVETYKKYFSKVVYLTATPIDFRAYGKDLEIIQVVDDREPSKVIATGYDKKELETVASIAWKQFSEKQHKIFIYLQSKGENLAEMKACLLKIGFTKIQILNSIDEDLFYQGKLTQDDLIDGIIKADVIVTTFSDGLSFDNKEKFDFICCSNVEINTAYQAMHRMRTGCENYFYITKANRYVADYDNIYEAAYQKTVRKAEEIRDSLRKIPDYNTKSVAYNVPEPLVNLDGTLLYSQIALEALKEVHKVYRYDYKCLETGFNKLNVKLVKWQNLVLEYELEYTRESKEKILNSIFYSIGLFDVIDSNLWPTHYRKEIEKIIELSKKMSMKDVEEFMLGEYLETPSSYEVKLMQLNLLDNPKDAQLKLRLENLILGKSFTADELHNLMEKEVKAINHPWKKKKYTSLIRGLGFELKRTSSIESGKKRDIYSVTKKII